MESTTVRWSHGSISSFGKNNQTVKEQTVGASVGRSTHFSQEWATPVVGPCLVKSKNLANFVNLQIIRLSLTGKKKRTKVFFEISADDEPVGRIEMELFDEITPR